MAKEETPEHRQDDTAYKGDRESLLRYLKPTTNKDSWHTAGTKTDWEQIEKDYQQANMKIMAERGYGMLAYETVKWFKERIG
jgi:hypothetical protein